MRFVKYLFIFSSFFCLGQNEIEKADTVKQAQIQLLTELKLENFSSLLICYYPDLNECKGFICEIDTLEFSEANIDIRAQIELFENEKFLIKYKFRESKDFIVGYFYLICFDNSMSMTMLDKSWISKIDYVNGFWEFIPASSDERDVVFVKDLGGKIIFYTKNE